MTNFNQNNNQFSNYVPGQFSFSQSAFQPGFSRTNAQEVRQQSAQSAQNQSQFGTGYQQNGQQFQQQGYMGPFSGSRAMFQHGFAGTNVQEVRQQNAQSAQNQSQFGTGYQQNGQQFQNQGNFGQFNNGPQAMFQHGFAGTNVQEVRQQNAQSAQNQSQFGTGYQQNGQQFQNQGNFGQFSGPQALFQHGSAGTNAQEVRQQNAQSAQNQSQFGTGFQGNFGRFQ